MQTRIVGITAIWVVAAALSAAPAAAQRAVHPAAAPAGGHASGRVSGSGAEAASLTLTEAVAAALEHNPSMKLAAAEMASSDAGYRLSRMPLMPRIGFAENITRGNNPVYVFGTKLRQQEFGSTDFSLPSLNHPSPRSNFATSISGSWQAFDSMHTRFEMRRAALLKRGSSASASRTEQEVIFRVVKAYEGVLIARREVEVARHAADTAQALYKQARGRVEAGVAVESDALSAQVSVASRQQDWIAAEGSEQSAWAELEAAVGTTLPEGPDSLASLAEHSFAALPLDDEIADAMRSRSDLKSLSLRSQAQREAVRAARSGYGPRVNLFGSWETDRQSFAGEGGANWTAGAELRVDLLPLETRARVEQQQAALEQAQAGEAMARSRIRVEVSRAYYRQQAAARMVDVARSSRAQATESLRILRNRYDAGLATLTEVLRAEDAERQSQSGYWQAVYRNAVSYAALRLATGTLNPGQVESFQ